MLKSARSKEFMTKEGRAKAYEQLKKFGIDALVAIGGNGTFTGAKIFSEEYGIPIVGLPGTIDNDLHGTDFTIGFDTANNTVIESVDRIRNTAQSHNRLFFVEVMGRDSGYIAAYTGLASGAMKIMIPERESSLEELIERLEKGRKNNKTSSIVIVSEGNKWGDAADIARQLKEKVDYYDSKVTILGHVQRGGVPSCFDRVLASRLGVAAVEGLLNGKSDIMIGITKNDISYTTFGDAIKTKDVVDNEILRVADILSI
jgi:6-phosphofructokinase 1